jgi:hypothetical protein
VLRGSPNLRGTRELCVTELTTAAIAFLCFCAGIAVGSALHKVADTRFRDGAKEIVGVGATGVTGVVVLLSAMLLGLLIASATSSFNDVANNFAGSAAKIALADQMLKDYGPEAAPARQKLCDNYTERLKELPIQGTWFAPLRNTKSETAASSLGPVASQVRNLSPATRDQTAIQASVGSLIEDVRMAHGKIFEESNTRTPKLLVIVVVFWLSTVFAAYAMQSPRSVITATTLLLGAVSVAAAIFLIEELDTPLDGLVTVSIEPLQRTLTSLCR